MDKLESLRVEAVIVHEIPHHLRKEDGTVPRLSESESPASTEIQNFLRERILIALKDAGHDVRFTVGASSPVPLLVSGWLADDKRGLVEISQRLAKHLHEVQSGNNPGGILIVAYVHVAKTRGLAILKLEKEEGIRLRESRTKDGKLMFALDHLRDLMLTQKTRVFKVGLFCRGRGEGGAITGKVCDLQRATSDLVARFFLETFLGCELLEKPEVTTQRFFDAAERHFNASISDPERRTRYQLALLAEMNSKRSAVQVDRFATDNLEVGDRKAFSDAVRASVPSHFDKSLDLLKNRVRRVGIHFESGVSVVAQPEHFEEVISIADAKDGRTRLQIEDRLRDMEGRR